MKHKYLLLNICILRILRYPSVKTQDTLFSFTWYIVFCRTLTWGKLAGNSSLC